MSCLPPEQIAAAAAGEDRDAVAHTLGCPACRARFDEQRALRRSLAGLSRPPLSSAARERLAAGVMARVEALDGARPSWLRLAGRAGLAAAALALAAWAIGQLAGGTLADRAPVASKPRAVTVPAVAVSGSSAPAAPAPAARPPLDLEASQASLPAKAPSAPSAVAAKLSGKRAEFGRATRSGRDVIELRDGALTVDARRTAPAEIRLGATAIHISEAKATVTARTGALASVAVFAGSVELSSGAQSTIVTAGTVWDAPAEPAADPDGSLAAFREGWIALRDKRFADAIAAFDRAGDAVVQEDAAYWAAVAASRAGDHDAARRRFADFLARFPESPRVDAARRALDVAPP
ncbi:MAG TPA: tetratricopeptide repeat protein [Kofleriaceae bacterium]|nr:tetratricopeptide repeat protein [Kofleriaceae bacterium]